MARFEYAVRKHSLLAGGDLNRSLLVECAPIYGEVGAASGKTAKFRAPVWQGERTQAALFQLLIVSPPSAQTHFAPSTAGDTWNVQWRTSKYRQNKTDDPELGVDSLSEFDVLSSQPSSIVVNASSVSLAIRRKVNRVNSVGY